jgi:hypothetical protein
MSRSTAGVLDETSLPGVSGTGTRKTRAVVAPAGIEVVGWSIVCSTFPASSLTVNLVREFGVVAVPAFVTWASTSMLAPVHRLIGTSAGSGKETVP